MALTPPKPSGPPPGPGPWATRLDGPAAAPGWLALGTVGWSWGILGAFAVTALVASLVPVPEALAAGALLLIMGVALARDPAHGLVILLLTTPFVLGEPKTPYFLLVHALALGTLMRAWVRSRRGGGGGGVAHGPLALAVLLAAVVALPLDLRDLIEDLWVADALDWPRWLSEGIPDRAPLKYLERVATLGLGLGLFTVAAHAARLEAIRAALLPLAVLTGAVSAFGLLRFFGAVHTTGQYLTLSAWTWRHPEHRLTAVAWNPDYLAQWLVLVLPLLLALLWIERAAWRRGLAGLAAVLTALALAFTLQRAGYLTALIAVATFGLLLGRAGHGLGWRWAWLGGLTGLVAGVAGLVDAVVLGGVIAERAGRLLSDPHRPRLWAAALRMAVDHPLLGVGTGRFAASFSAYDAPGAAPLGPFWGTAHSLYLHLAAEQGLVGLVSFIVFVGAVGVRGVRALEGIPPARAFLGCGLLAGLAGWLAYGVVQFTLRVHGLAYAAFIVMGAVAALAPPVAGARRRGRGLAAALALAAAGALLLTRIDAALARPVSPAYEAGFHRWEPQRDGTLARWTRGRAAMSVPVQGGILELRLRAPLPGIETRPQAVRVWVDRRAPLVVVIAGPDWHALRVPVARPRGQHVLVELATAYTVVPSRLGVSRDDRRLGVMVARPSWRDAAAGPV